MAKTISWQRSCLWLSCCWTLAACMPWTAAAAASHLVQMTPPAVVMVIGGRGDGPDPGSPAPAPTQQQQRTADSTITHPYRNSTVVSAQAPEAATVSVPVNNAPTAPAANANPSTPSPPPPAEAQTTVASSPSSIPSGALIPTPTPPPTAPITPSTPTTKTQPAESSPPTLPSPANKTNAPTIPRSAPPPATAGKPTVKTQAARSSTVKEEEPLPLCDIDPCVHLQLPCPELKEAKGWSCTCPGAGGGASSGGASSTTAPGPVVALEVTRVWPQSAGVRWCAPYSSSSSPPLTSSFLVWALRQTDGSVAVSNASVSSRARRTDVFGLEAGHGYLLCVSAASAGRNGVGSAVSHTRCVPVSTPRDGGVIATYVLAGSCAALMLTAVMLSGCLHRQCERGRASGGAPPPAALLLNNPTTAAAQMAQMVSIANPAYAHPEERAPCTGVNAHHTHSSREQAKKSTNVNRK